MSIVTWIVVTSILAYLIQKLYKYMKFRKILSKLPGPEISNIITGNLYIIEGLKNQIDIHTAFAQMMVGLSNVYREQGICRFWSSIDPYVVLYSAETIEPIVSSTTLIDKSKVYNLLHDWLGMGLLTSTGSKWKSRRKVITPTFHYQILNEFIPTFEKNTKIFISKLKEHLDNEWFDIIPLVSLCTLDIISETAMGIEIKAQNKICSDYLDALQEFCELLMIRAVKPWFHNNFIYSLTSDGKKHKKVVTVLHSLTLKILKQRKEELRMESTDSTETETLVKKKEPLLDTLIKYQFKNSNFLDKDICEEVDTFMFEGHDTTSMGISWALYHLGLYPDIQQKVYEEVRSIIGDDRDRPITASDVKEMKYLESVLKESQRISPSVPIVERFCTEDTKIKGYTIPRGSTLNIFIYGLHRDPKVFPDPEVFGPDRFLPENCIGRHPYAYIPFSAGPRNCIGQKYAMLEMKVIVSSVINNFRIESIDPPDKISSSFVLVLRPTKSLKIKLYRRD